MCLDKKVKIKYFKKDENVRQKKGEFNHEIIESYH